MLRIILGVQVKAKLSPPSRWFEKLSKKSSSPIFSQLIALKEDFELCSEVGEIWPSLQTWKKNLLEISILSFECDSDWAIGKSDWLLSISYALMMLLNFWIPIKWNIFPLLLLIYFASSSKNIFPLLLLLQEYISPPPPNMFFLLLLEYILPPRTKIYFSSSYKKYISPSHCKVEIWIFKHSRDGLKIRLGPEISWH